MDRFCYFLLLLVLQRSACHEITTASYTGDLCGHLYSIKNTVKDLELKISQQNIKIAQQNTKIAERIIQQDAKNSQQDALISQKNTEIAQQNAKIAQLNAKIADQNIKILLQNENIEDLQAKLYSEHEEGGTTKPHSTSNNTGSTVGNTGSVFTRWGRTDCPSGVSELVYSGFTGGSYYLHKGGAAEYVCLPPHPSWNVNKHYNGPSWGYMYGTEYETLPQPIKNYKVPCAVCRTARYSTVLMIPAKTECYEGWTEAYHGELVTGYYNYNPSQYVCLDEQPQTSGPRTNDNGKLMYPVRAVCGALPCPPYENNTLLTCAVCLK